MFHRHSFAVLPALLGLVLAAVLPVAAAAPASAAASAAHLSVHSASVQLTAPDRTKPLTDDCWRGWSGALCGYGTVSFDLSGFDAFGGVPSCDPDDPAYSENCEDPVLSLVETPGTRIDLVVRCAGKVLPRVASVPVSTEPTHLVGPSDVSGFNRIDSDRAHVSILFYFPTPARIGVCGDRAAQLLTASARNITVGWSSASSAIPAGPARIPGVHRFHLS